MRSYIIGIAGELNSGKDTLASMINYIFAVGITKANFQDWLINKVKWDETNKDRITHFADPLKDCLSIMYNIPREYFDDRVKKDKEWFIINENRFINEDQSNSAKYAKITMEVLHFNDTLSNVISHILYGGYQPIIKLRTLMQYFGTEIGRETLQDDLWIRSTMNRAAGIADHRRVCLIPDIRFTNELDAIRTNSLYGGDIEITRNQSGSHKHASETIDFTCKYLVNNSGTKTQTFYQAINIVSNIIKT